MHVWKEEDKFDRMIRDNKIDEIVDTGLMDLSEQHKFSTRGGSVHEAGLLVPGPSIVSVGRTLGERKPCVCPAPAGRKPLIIGVEMDRRLLNLDFIKNHQHRC